MRKFSLLGILAALAVTLLMYASPAQAQATRTWVSGVGDDANPCSRTAPCKTFAGAISKTAASGEINCLDPGGFGAVTITKAISIICETGTAGVLVSGTNGIVVAAGATDHVYLEGLDFEGLAPAAGPGLNGIRIITAGTVVVRKSLIQEFSQSGIDFEPSATTNLVVEDTAILSSATSAGTSPPFYAGVNIKPQGAGSATFEINRAQIANNGFGIIADGSATTGFIRGTVRDSVVAQSVRNGITTSNGTASNISIVVDNTSVVGNAFGLASAGTGAGMIVGNSTVAGNATGVLASAPGVIYSYGTNKVNGNTTADGSFTSTIPQK